MSPFCEALLALGLTFGLFCEPEAAAGKRVALPDGDAAAWVHEAPPRPEIRPPPPVPSFPVVIVRPPPETIVRELPREDPPPLAAAEPEPAPDPYRVALALVLASGPRARPEPLAVAMPRAMAKRTQAPLDMSAVNIPQIAAPAVPAEAGVAAPAGYGAPGRLSTRPVDNSRILTADRYIAGVLETGFNSQVASAEGGPAIVQTSRDVFGYHGRRILIPKGSRLICAYESAGRPGDTRIGFNCERILIAGHRAEILQLAAPLGDAQGRGGVAGEVDSRFWERYGTAFMLAGISATVRLASAAAAPNRQESTMGTIADAGASELSERFAEITAAVLEETVNLAPVITIPQGARVQIRPARDWYIARPAATLPTAFAAAARETAPRGAGESMKTMTTQMTPRPARQRTGGP